MFIFNDSLYSKKTIGDYIRTSNKLMLFTGVPQKDSGLNGFNQSKIE